MNKQVLVIAAHPDDEVIGCGGTLARHAAVGDIINIIFLADGESSRSGAQASIKKRQAMAKNAANILGCHEPIFLGLADNQLDTLPFLHIVQTLEQATRELAPSVIYTHHGGDLNIDHRLTCQATLTAFRPQPGSIVQAIYSFDISSSTEWSHPSLTPPFHPQRFHDITPWLAIKEAALTCYQSEMREKPHSRSIDGIRYRDLHRGHTVGCHAAEAFEVIREIWL
jgi:N-acetylglucosamine malate deacetylase 1